MKELDALLTGYLESCYENADEPEKAAFRSILELPDPVLVSYLLYGNRPESELECLVVKRILGRTAT